MGDLKTIRMFKNISVLIIFENESSAIFSSDLWVLATAPFHFKSSVSSVYCKQYFLCIWSGVVMFQLMIVDKSDQGYVSTFKENWEAK